MIKPRLLVHGLAGVVALVALTATAAETTKPLAYLDELPPLLDRQLFFGDPEISGAQISPDGKFVTFMRPYEGVRNIWIKGIDEDFDNARPLTDDERPVPGYFWSRDSEYVLYAQDKGGDENFHAWAVDADAEPAEDSAVPPARNLTDLDGVRAQIYSVPKSTPGQIIVGLNDRDPALHDVYRVDIESGERELLIENNQNIAGWVVGLEGNVRLAVRQTEDGGTETLRVSDGEVGETLYTCSWQETCGPNRFHSDNKRVWFQTNKGEDNDLVGLYLMDAETGEMEFVERDPEGEVDFSGAIYSNATDELLATAYVGDKPRIYPKDERFEQALAFLREQLPEGEIGLRSLTADDSLALVSLSRDVDPGTVYLFNWEEMEVSELYRSRPELPVEHMAEMQPIRYEARDGLEIPAYLTTPKGVEGDNLALVALIHGGPWARDTWGYNSLAQFLANRGYAVLQPNFRGSTGYGKAFLNAGNNEWGDAMQDDITDGVRHLVDKGLVDPERVCIMGGSYGGYATLAGMTFTPELYTCGVDIVGPSNLITLINSIPPYWGPIRKIFDLRMGDASTEEGREQLERQSPLNHVDKIAAPLLVIQGANDPRVKQAEADQIVVAMREAGLPVEYIVAPDEGHGFRGRTNRLAMMARIEDFLATHLGGREQESREDEVATRLAEITVDVDSVELPEQADELDAARTLPLPTPDPDAIALGTLEYVTELNVQGNAIRMETTRTLAKAEQEAGPVIEIVSNATSPMGEASDRMVIDARTLRPISRTLSQGPATIEVEYSDREVTGRISAGQEIPINIELDAPVYGSDSALEAAIMGLPLEAGYRTPIRVAEVGMQQRVRYFVLEVTGRETVEVPAGEYEAWKVSLEALDGEGGDMTLWVTTETPRKVLRVQGELPAQMGGGEYNTELTGVGE
ncbi:alpha/beta fold hydrolase [Wenzhouxiangella sp. XN201]|uniref:S9 family peptidase n=1 Tax=Wenzhouxiangella sp. XN201 TaxID=2710755 RepID=UPI0013CA79C5|nr:alpha/beta fold hydrolase [Wenzhouxiangella sp. XN201]NEZ04347.1 alpha/beta fold hydrolase [Wenzhouxiangella sp. XN201]